MKRSAFILSAGVCFSALVTVAMAQQPAMTPSAGETNGPPAAVRSITITGQSDETGNILIDARKLRGESDQLRELLKHKQLLLGFPSRSPVDELLDQWKAAQQGAERDKIKEKLREVLNKQFQERAVGQEKEIEQLEAKVKQLREKLDLRRKKQGEIVDFRLQQLLREAEGLGWGAEDEASGRTKSAHEILLKTMKNSDFNSSTIAEPLAPITPPAPPTGPAGISVPPSTSNPPAPPAPPPGTAPSGPVPLR